MAVLFFDEFVGTADDEIAGHVPDTNVAAGLAWNGAADNQSGAAWGYEYGFSSSGLVFTGTGAAKGPNFGGAAGQILAPGRISGVEQAYPAGLKFGPLRFTIVWSSGKSSTTSPDPWDSTKVMTLLVGSTGSTYGVSFTHFSGAAHEQLVGPSGNLADYTPTYTAGGVNTTVMEIGDGELVVTHNGLRREVAIALADADIQMGKMYLNLASDVQVRSLLVESAGPTPPPPPFWADLVNTYEVP